MRWGIIGSGRIAQAFADAITHVPGASISAVASRSLDRARDFAARVGASRVFTKAADLAADRHVDIVYIATPHHRHEDDALVAIDAAKPVLCEKPLAPNEAAARRIAAAAKAHGTFCMEGLWSLCLPVYREAFIRIANGEIGQVRELAGTFSTPIAFDPASRFWDAAQYGGALLDRGVYLVHLALALVPDMRPVYARCTRATTGVDASTAFVLESELGIRAMFSVSLQTQGLNDFRVQCTEGRCTFLEPLSCPPAYWLQRDTASGGAQPATSRRRQLRGWLRRQPIIRRASRSRMHGSQWRRGGLEDEIAEVERCVQSGLIESPHVPLQRSLRASEILGQIATLSS